MVQTTFISKMNGRHQRASGSSKVKLGSLWRGKSQGDQGSMVRKLPASNPSLDNPVFAAEVYNLKMYQGYVKQIKSNWEELVMDVPMLHKVCFEGYLNTVKELLASGEDVNEPITDGPKLLRFLSGGFMSYSAFCVESTPLMMASHQGHIEIIKLLLRHGAKVDQKDSIGSTALSLAVSSQRMDACRLLQKNGADVNSVDDKYHFSPFILACRKNDTELAKWLIRKGANVKHTDIYGRSGLHYAAWNYNQDLIQFCLSHRLDVNGRDYYGWAPIHFCVGDMDSDFPLEKSQGLDSKSRIQRGFGKGGEEWFALVALLENGADPDHLDPNGETPLHALASRLPSAVLSDGLVNVSDRKKNEKLLISMMILIDKGANIHRRNAEDMSVMEVCRSRDNFVADRLLDELTISVSMATLGTSSGNASMGSAATTATMGFNRHFSIDAMEEEIRQLVDMLLANLMSRKRKGTRRRYTKGCVIS